MTATALSGVLWAEIRQDFDKDDVDDAALDNPNVATPSNRHCQYLLRVQGCLLAARPRVPMLDEMVAAANITINSDCSNAGEFAWSERCALLRNCTEDSWIPSMWLQNCALVDLSDSPGVGFRTAQVLFAFVVLGSVTFWACNLLQKVASHCFSPALQDICDQAKVPQRSAAMTLVAFANGAPDLASSISAMQKGKLDMAFGGLLGAGCFVSMVVVGMILRAMRSEGLSARGAFLRDAFALLAVLLSLLSFQLGGGGFGVSTCVAYLLAYGCLVFVVAYFDHWHHFRNRSLSPRFVAAINAIPVIGPAVLRLLQVDGELAATYHGWESLSESGSDLGVMLLAPSMPLGGSAERGGRADGSPRQPESAAMLEAARRAHQQLSRAFAEGVLLADGHDTSAAGPFDRNSDAPPTSAFERHLESPSNRAPPPPTASAVHAADGLPLQARSPVSGAVPSGSQRAVAPDKGQNGASQDTSVSPSCDSSFNIHIRPSDSASNAAPGRFEMLEVEHHIPGGPPKRPRDMTVWDRHWITFRNEFKDKLTVLLPAEDGGEVGPDGSVDDFAWFHWSEMSLLQRAAALSAAGSMVPIRLATPIVAASHYHPVLFAVNLALAPFAFALLGLGLPLGWCAAFLLPLGAAVGVGTLILVKDELSPPRWLYATGPLPFPPLLLLFSLLNITMAVVFIQLIAGELVSALVAFGAVTGCPEGLLGLVVSFGNSMGDLATNVGIAKATFMKDGVAVTGERVAVSACMNGQLFNLLLAPAIGLLLRMRAVPGVVRLDLTWPVWFLADALAAYMVLMIAASLWQGHTLSRGFMYVSFASFGCLVLVLTGGFAPAWISAVS